MRITEKLIGGAIALFVAFSAPATVSADELRFSTPTPPPHIFTRTAERLAEALSDDDNTIEVFPVNQLGNVPTVLSLLQSGGVELAIVPVGDLANRDPAFYGWFLPFQFETLAEAGAAANSEPAQEMLARLDQQGITGLGYVFPGQRHVLSKTPVTSVSDFEGLKVRAFPNDIFSAWWRELDAAPTALPLPEIMPSLVTGVIDAVDVDVDIVFGLSMHNQAPNLVLTNHMAFPGAVLASKRWWDGLDEATQERFLEAVSEAQAWAIETQTAGEATLLERLEADGASISTLDAAELREAGAVVRDAFLERDPLIGAFYEANQ
ncbi:MAG: TRAP transporter substrate-binding protein [Cohaesibacteraceae bacterium]